MKYAEIVSSRVNTAEKVTKHPKYSMTLVLLKKELIIVSGPPFLAPTPQTKV